MIIELMVGIVDFLFFVSVVVIIASIIRSMEVKELNGRESEEVE